MILHNYGPDIWSGSVNVEIDHKKTAGEIFQILHSLQLKVLYEYSVYLVFGIYAVDNEREDVNSLRNAIKDFVENHKHVKSFHAVYIEPNTENIYCDLTVDYELKDQSKLQSEFENYMKKLYPNSEINVTVETEYV